MWLRDSLPSRCPTARIITYGYNSAMDVPEDQVSHDVLYGHANTLVVKWTDFQEEVSHPFGIAQLLC